MSEGNFIRVNECWNDERRVEEPAYFGWLQTQIPGYVDTLNIKTMVHTQAVGIIPRIELLEEDHTLTLTLTLTLEQQTGITWQRVTELVEIAMHG